MMVRVLGTIKDFKIYAIHRHSFVLYPKITAVTLQYFYTFQLGRFGFFFSSAGYEAFLLLSN